MSRDRRIAAYNSTIICQRKQFSLERCQVWVMHNHRRTIITSLLILIKPGKSDWVTHTSHTHTHTDPRKTSIKPVREQLGGFRPYLRCPLCINACLCVCAHGFWSSSWVFIELLHVKCFVPTLTPGWDDRWSHYWFHKLTITIKLIAIESSRARLHLSFQLHVSRLQGHVCFRVGVFFVVILLLHSLCEFTLHLFFCRNVGRVPPSCCFFAGPCNMSTSHNQNRKCLPLCASSPVKKKKNMI